MIIQPLGKCDLSYTNRELCESHRYKLFLRHQVLPHLCKEGRNEKQACFGRTKQAVQAMVQAQSKSWVCHGGQCR
jgi:hypothetical protein